MFVQNFDLKFAPQRKKQCIPLKLYKGHWCFCLFRSMFFNLFQLQFPFINPKKKYKKDKKNSGVAHFTEIKVSFLVHFRYFIHFSTFIKITPNILIIFFSDFQATKLLGVHLWRNADKLHSNCFSIFTCQGLIDLICIATQKNSYDLTYLLIQKPDLFTTCITC